jgi:hypothetical protein
MCKFYIEDEHPPLHISELNFGEFSFQGKKFSQLSKHFPRLPLLLLLLLLLS